VTAKRKKLEDRRGRLAKEGTMGEPDRGGRWAKPPPLSVRLIGNRSLGKKKRRGIQLSQRSSTKKISILSLGGGGKSGGEENPSLGSRGGLCFPKGGRSGEKKKEKKSYGVKRYGCWE